MVIHGARPGQQKAFPLASWDLYRYCCAVCELDTLREETVQLVSRSSLVCLVGQ